MGLDADAIVIGAGLVGVSEFVRRAADLAIVIECELNDKRYV